MCATNFRIQSLFSVLLRSLFFTLICLCLFCVNYSNADVIYPSESGPHDKLRETGIVGESFIDHFEKYHSISSGGDLNLNIPLYTIPGKIPIDLQLHYQSGIKIDQPATWVGLGWQFGGWSVRRIPVHGDDPNSFDQDKTNTRDVINDMYVVNIPGKNLKFINTGSRSNPIYTPLSYTNDSLYSDDTLKTHAVWPFWDHNYFIMVDENGSKYVFARPLIKRTMQGPDAIHLPCIHIDTIIIGPLTIYDTTWVWTTPITANTEWLLTAILSHDYVDGYGDSLNPLDGDPDFDPRTDNAGYWVSFAYSGWCEWGNDNSDEGTSDMLCMGPLVDPNVANGSGANIDSTEIAYLRKIITPSTVVQLDLNNLYNYRTPRFSRSNGLPDHRVRDAVLSRLRVFAYSGDSTLPAGPELYCINFNYEEYSNPGPHLKANMYDKYDLLNYSIDGEPSLRKITISQNSRYMPQDSWAGLDFTTGYKKEYSFEYNDDSSYFYEDFYPLTSDFNTIYSNWASGGRCFFQYDSTYSDTNVYSINLNMMDTIVKWHISSDGEPSHFWGHRDFFGYYHEHPESWSMKSFTTTEGLQYSYNYEPDEFMLEGNRWTGGGCRVNSVIINDYFDWFGWFASTESDYLDKDTIVFTYGNGQDSIGFVTAMPTVYNKLKTRYLDNIVNYAPGCGYFTLTVEKFIGDNVSHEVQYPLIQWLLPKNRGIIEDYYITTDSVAGHKKRTMVHEDNVLVCKRDEQIEIGAWVDFFYSFWQDRSPFLGVPYKRVLKSNIGNECFYEQKYYSWIPIDLPPLKRTR